jgi:acetyltransferase-like isoleucine patch superfamily enzyme
MKPIANGALPSLATRMYRSLMGVGAEKINVAPAHEPRLRDVVYYAARRGFRPLIRGALMRPRLERCGGRFFLGRHAQVLFPSRLSVGRNVSLGDYIFVNCYSQRGITIGHNVRIREFSIVQATSHLSYPGIGLRVGNDTYIGPHCILGAGGGIEIGNGVTLGAYVQVLAENHEFADPAREINEQGVTRRGIAIEDDCWLGNSVIVLDGVTIGRGCVVGAGSVVTRDLSPHSVAVGNPARVIKSRDQ